MHEMSHPDMWFGGMWWMWLGGLLFWGSLIAFGVWAVRRFTDRGGGGNARRILDERFARGDIDAEEYQSRLQALGEATGR
jgi:putative membrane protein